MNKPPNLDPLADEILQRLAKHRESEQIVLGGYFALQHYLSYRATHDIDAWWRDRAAPQAEQAIRSVMNSIADERGFELRERKFGETLSLELFRHGRKHFSFQIAARSIGLEKPELSAWAPVMIETLRDNVGSKMNALVDRGTPRDLTDVKRVVDAGLLTSDECWQLWARKNPGQSAEAAKQKVLYHLQALEMRRPLEKIENESDRQQADATRRWYNDSFLRS
jgi:hypothetical protein